MTALPRRVAHCLAPVVLGLCPASAALAAARQAPITTTGPGIHLAGQDPSVAPGDDFFAYANGGWLKQTAIPPDRASYGVGSVVFELTSQRIAELIQQAGRAQPPTGSEARKISDYYASYMDEAGIEALGLRPLQSTLDRIAAVADRKALAAARSAQRCAPTSTP
jgi:putative endopeptidase